MERIDKIIKNPVFLENLYINMEAEKGRQFCRHDMAHFLDVARIGRIINLEERFGVEDELIYAAGLLHDIARHLQYSQGSAHELEGAVIAGGILRECGFGDREVGMVMEAISAHRTAAVVGQHNLNEILYRADKASRACFCCPAAAECNWGEEKKNLKVVY